MKRLIITMTCLAGALTLSAQDKPFLEDLSYYTENLKVFELNQEEGRAYHIPEKSLLLNGTWKFIIDKDNSGGEKGYMLNNCDTSLWRCAEIPCTYEGAAQECTGYRGTVWFRRTFNVNEVSDALMWLEFAAVNYRADVWINEQPVGFHIFDYLPFRFEISK